MTKITPEQVDALLPQTQCGLCTHGGCMPYAEAMVYEQAPINLCPPGGVKVLRALGELLAINAEAYVADMQQKAKSPAIAVIREAECIGCTKCIQACPVDAILGSAKHMHTVIITECTGCELCIPPCPVDCIDLLMIGEQEIKKDKADYSRERFIAHEKRLQKEKKLKKEMRQEELKSSKVDYVKAAIERAKMKKHR